VLGCSVGTFFCHADQVGDLVLQAMTLIPVSTREPGQVASLCVKIDIQLLVPQRMATEA